MVPPSSSESLTRPSRAMPVESWPVLPYDVVRGADSPDSALKAFLESTYEAAADLGQWDRNRLEWGPGEQPPVGGFSE